MVKLTLKNIFLSFNLFSPVFLWAGLIFFLSAQPELSSGLPSIWDFVLRKAAHITEYAIFTFLIFRALRGYNINKESDTSTCRLLIISIILAILYAFSDEYHQTFVERRTGSLLDVGIDSIGIIMAGFLTWRKY